MAKTLPEKYTPVINEEGGGLVINKDTLAFQMLSELDNIYNAAYNTDLTPTERGTIMTRAYDDLKELIVENVSRLWD